MKINTNSICNTCIYFEHECGEPNDYDGCSEYCTHKDKAINKRFEEEFEIHKCTGHKIN